METINNNLIDEPVYICATIEDLKQLYSLSAINMLADSSPNGSIELDYTLLERGLINASSEINLYIGNRYNLPLLSPIPYSIREWWCVICVYKRSTEKDKLTEERRLRYEDVIKSLKDISTGKLSIPNIKDSETDTGDGGNNVSSDDSDFEAQPRIFTRQKMRGL